MDIPRPQKLPEVPILVLCGETWSKNSGKHISGNSLPQSFALENGTNEYYDSTPKFRHSQL